MKECYIIERNKYTPANQVGEIIARKWNRTPIRLRDGCYLENGGKSNLTVYPVFIIDDQGAKKDDITCIHVYESYGVIIAIYDSRMNYIYMNQASYSPSSDRHKTAAEKDITRYAWNSVITLIRVNNDNNRCAANNMDLVLDKLINSYVNGGNQACILIRSYISHNSGSIFKS